MSILDKIKTVTVDDAINEYKKYEYYLIYGISEVKLGKTALLSQLDMDELKGAYFFDKSGQMHIYQDNEFYMAITIADDEKEDHYLNKKYDLANKFAKDGYKTLSVKEYLDFDDDGQFFVAYTRLTGLE